MIREVNGQPINTEFICNGDCCSRFFLPLPPEEMWKKYQEFIMSGIEKFEDIAIIGPMLIPIEPDKEKGWWYTCKHWNTESKLCEIYEKRPRMCALYPYGDECTYCYSTCGTVKKTQKDALPAGPISIELLEERKRQKDAE